MKCRVLFQRVVDGCGKRMRAMAHQWTIMEIIIGIAQTHISQKKCGKIIQHA